MSRFLFLKFYHALIVICQLYWVVCPVFPYPRTFTNLPFSTSTTPFLRVKNITKWGLSQSPDCTFCLNPESLLHTLSLVHHFTWSHDSILNFIANSLRPVINDGSSPYVDVNGSPSPSMISGGNYRPDRLFLIQSKCLSYILELTVGLEPNLKDNAVRKKEKYMNLVKDMKSNYRCVNFVNLSMSSLVFSPTNALRS